MALLTIDGVAMPTPSSITVKYADLDSEASSRTRSGILHRSRIRSDVVSAQVTWKALTESRATALANALKPVSFTAVIVTPNGTISRTMYAGDKDFTLVHVKGSARRWDVSTDLVEY